MKICIWIKKKIKWKSETYKRDSERKQKGIKNIWRDYVGEREKELIRECGTQEKGNVKKVKEKLEKE